MRLQKAKLKIRTHTHTHTHTPNKSNRMLFFLCSRPPLCSTLTSSFPLIYKKNPSLCLRGFDSLPVVVQLSVYVCVCRVAYRFINFGSFPKKNYSWQNKSWRCAKRLTLLLLLCLLFLLFLCSIFFLMISWSLLVALPKFNNTGSNNNIKIKKHIARAEEQLKLADKNHTENETMFNKIIAQLQKTLE